jgi:hypothetical protein
MPKETTEISLGEWKQISEVEEFKQAWEFEADDTPEMLASLVHGLKVSFNAGSPGYSGDLFIIDIMREDGPMVLIRGTGGQLVVSK